MSLHYTQKDIMIPVSKIKTKAYLDQNPGTSGLRKRVLL